MDSRPVNKETARLMVEMAVDQIRYQSAVIQDFQKESAKLEFSYFLELVTAGFTEEQAIKIVQSHGFMPKVNGATE